MANRSDRNQVIMDITLDPTSVLPVALDHLVTITRSMVHAKSGNIRTTDRPCQNFRTAPMGVRTFPPMLDHRDPTAAIIDNLSQNSCTSLQATFNRSDQNLSRKDLQGLAYDLALRLRWIT